MLIYACIFLCSLAWLVSLSRFVLYASLKYNLFQANADQRTEKKDFITIIGFFFVCFLTKHPYTRTHTVCLTVSALHLEIHSAAAASLPPRPSLHLDLNRSDIYQTNQTRGFWYFERSWVELNDRSHHCLWFMGCVIPETYIKDKRYK